MKKEIKNHKNIVEYSILKRWKRIVPVGVKMLRIKILVSEELNKVDYACIKVYYLW